MQVQVLMSGWMFPCSRSNPPCHCSLCFCGKGPLRSGRGLSWVNIKQQFLPLLGFLITPRLLRSYPAWEQGGGLCHSSSVQTDRVHEYPGEEKQKKKWGCYNCLQNSFLRVKVKPNQATTAHSTRSKRGVCVCVAPLVSWLGQFQGSLRWKPKSTRGRKPHGSIRSTRQFVFFVYMN